MMLELSHVNAMLAAVFEIADVAVPQQGQQNMAWLC